MNSNMGQTLEAFWNSPHRTAWIKGIVIAGVLGLSTMIALQSSTRMVTLILALVGAATAFTALLRFPGLGIIGVLLGAFFIPFTGPGGVNMAVIGTAGVSGLWILDMLIRQRKFTLKEKSTTIPILFFILSAVISFFIGMLPWYPLAFQAPIDAQAGGLAMFLLSALIFLMVSNAITSLRWLQIISWVYITIGALYILARLVPPVNSLILSRYYPSTVGNSLFWVWLVLIPFSQGLLNNRLPKFIRVGLLLLVAGTFYVAVVQASEWKSGYLPALAGMATIIALMLRRKVFFLTPVILAIAYMLGAEAISTDQYSYITRVDAWRIVIELAAISPLFGLGFSNYYWYTHLKPILGWRVAFNSHSQYVDLIAQTGIVGMAMFGWIFLAIWNVGWKVRNTAPDGFAKAYTYGALGGVVATVIAGTLGDWVLPFVYNVGMNGFRSSIFSWIFLGGLIALYNILKKEQIPVNE